MDEAIPSLRTIVAQVPDPRRARGRRHAWSALLLLVVVALLCGANSQRALARWGQMVGWAGLQRLGFTRRGGPSLATVHRLLRTVEVTRLEQTLGAWLQQVRAAWRHSAARWLDGIAVDGKTLRGARRLGAADAHLLSACCQRRGLVLAEAAVPDTTNELGAVGPLLARLLLDGETVTFDAEFPQWAVAEQVVQQGGAYLMVIKGNQPTLRAGCAAATERPLLRPTRQYGQARSVRLAHGRCEERTLWAADALAIPWPHARQVLRLHRRMIAKATGAVLTDEFAYALTSLAPEQASPRDLLRLWQAHWQIENRLHWVRDVVFGEDRATTRTGHAPQALAALRNLAIALLHRWYGPDITAGRQYYAGHPAALFRRLDWHPRRL